MRSYDARYEVTLSNAKGVFHKGPWRSEYGYPSVENLKVFVQGFGPTITSALIVCWAGKKGRVITSYEPLSHLPS